MNPITVGLNAPPFVEHGCFRIVSAIASVGAVDQHRQTVDANPGVLAFLDACKQYRLVAGIAALQALGSRLIVHYSPLPGIIEGICAHGSQSCF